MIHNLPSVHVLQFNIPAPSHDMTFWCGGGGPKKKNSKIANFFGGFFGGATAGVAVGKYIVTWNLKSLVTVRNVF